MNPLGIEAPVQNKPLLDPEFLAIGLFNRAFLRDARKPVFFAVERDNGRMATVLTHIHGTGEHANPHAIEDEWSGDICRGVKCFSQG